jgi:hypothetical protein
VTALIAAINALSLIPLWVWARRRMDEERALLTLAVAAVSPFAVLFSRKIWPVDLLLPGMIAVLWSVERLREGRLWRAIALAGFGVLLIAQLHQSGVITAPLLLVAAGIQLAVDARRGRRSLARSRPSILEVVAILVVVAANLFFWGTYLPYLVTVPPEAFMYRPREPSFAPQLLFNVISEVVPRHVLSPFYVEHLPFGADLLRGSVYYVSIALGGPLAAYGVWRWLRSPLTLPVVGIWWWLVIAAFALLRIPSHEYYVLAVMPLPILLAAGAFDAELSPWWARALWLWRWIYVTALLALTLVTGAWLTNRGGSRGDYGVTFEIQRAQAQSLLARRRGEPVSSNRRLGEAASDEQLQLRCQPPSEEVIWIVEWLAPQSSPSVRAFEICDAWIGTGHDAVYRWAIRQAP